MGLFMLIASQANSMGILAWNLLKWKMDAFASGKCHVRTSKKGWKTEPNQIY